MRTAPDTPDNGQTIVTTTKRTVLPADPTLLERKTPEFWSYLQSLKNEDWDKHIVYIYRRFDTGPSQPLEKCAVYFVMPDGTKIPLANQEELEIAIAQTYGGGSYRIWIKKGSERITETRITIDGPAKNTQPGILRNAETSGTAPAVATSTDVATTAMHLVANHEAEAINVGLGMMRTAAEVQQRMAQVPPASESDQILRQLMVVMLQRAMSPPDPLELITKLLPLLDRKPAGDGTNGAATPGSLVERILETGLERVLNPPPSGPVSSAGAELVRQLPQVASYVTQAIQEWRIGSEAQLKTAQIMATGAARPALPGAPATVQPNPSRPITQATQIPPPPPQSQPLPEGAPTLEFIEQKVVDILKKPITTDEAADEVLTFLDLMAPTLIDQLARLTEAEMVQVFQTRPVLRQYHDLARLQEFARAFLKYANSTDAPPEVEPSSKPN